VPGHCPTCVPTANPAIFAGTGKPWGDNMIQFDVNGQICYGPKCASDTTGQLEVQYTPWIANGKLQDSSNNPILPIDGFQLRVYQRNQADQSTCWANSAVEIVEVAQQLETQHIRKDQRTDPEPFAGPLSNAMIVKCVANAGTGGGSPIDALNWMMTHQLPLMSQVHGDGSTPCPPEVPKGQGTVQSIVFPITTCGTGPCGGQGAQESQLALAVAKMPTLIYVDASTWQGYSAQIVNGDIASQVYPSTACTSDPSNGNHVVILHSVARCMRTGRSFWKVLNSWGKGWGADGFIYLEMGVNACGLANWPVSVEDV